MAQPSVTVLMPVYNAERFLSEAIDSILNQTFADFEFLILDDGSTDSSVKIINSYCDQRIVLVQNETNLGITASLNKGINLARAGLIARMDADDISYPDRLQKQYTYLNEHPDCALVSTLARVITEDKQTVYIDKTDSNYFYYNLTFCSPIYHPSVMYRKTAVQDVGMYTVPYSEDFELFWLLSRRYKIYNLPEVLLDYRNNPQSLHQVTKRKEYTEAAFQQTTRNLRFYAGENYSIAKDYVNCFQYDIEPLLKQRKIGRIVKCFRELEFITERIIGTENVNRDIKNIRKAALYKRRFTLTLILKQLPRSKSALLLLRLWELSMLLNHVKYFLKRKIRF
ncbi:glycosyltransferase family 2 protein [Terrimonas alba]|uniref:glycosyltransferase family 2 protein n=1 Tax=Terrimonas alba TaxID=3349636 RepID=UPI0035F2AEB9